MTLVDTAGQQFGPSSTIARESTRRGRTLASRGLVSRGAVVHVLRLTTRCLLFRGIAEWRVRRATRNAVAFDGWALNALDLFCRMEAARS